MKKKLITLILSAALAASLLALTACGNADTASSDIESQVESQETSSVESIEPVESIPPADESATPPAESMPTTEANTNNAAGNTNQANSNTANHKPSGGNTNTGTVNKAPAAHTGGTNNGGNTAAQTPVAPKPEPQYTKKWVVDKAAWTETVPVYTTVAREICNKCGQDITDDIDTHIEWHADKGEAIGWHTEYKKIQTGTKTINHPEEGHWETVLV